MIRTIRTAAIVVFVTLVLCELTLRLFTSSLLSSPLKSAAPDEALFWKYSSSLGWDILPSSSGHFSNGFFDGLVSVDENGIRKNSKEGTFVPGYRNILFIGDSTTASFEVNDDQTVPAILERMLRAGGDQVNVLNLGIRGYGTDQSVLRAMAFAGKYPPSDIIYMYTDNDVLENNSLRKRNRKFGKGAYVRFRGSNDFVPVQYPVPDREPGYTGMVVLDRACHPVLHEETAAEGARPVSDSPRKDTDGSVAAAILARSYTAKAFTFIKSGIRQALAGNQRTTVDPYDTLYIQGKRLNGLKFRTLEEIYRSYEDDGLLRHRCSGYFSDQMQFLIDMMKSRTGNPRIHVVQFPVSTTVDLLKGGSASPTSQLFDSLASKGTIADHINLPQIAVDQAINLAAFTCKGDGHFCADGNKWIAAELYKRFAGSQGRAQR
jgi:hypothetical protein